MTPAEYVNSVSGKPYKLGATGSAFDCWTLVVDSFDKIDGIELPAIGERDGYSVHKPALHAIKRYRKCARKEGAIAMCVDSHGLMVHVGRVLCGGILHAGGDRQKSAGSVMLSEIDFFESCYRRLGGRVDYLELIDGND